LELSNDIFLEAFFVDVDVALPCCCFIDFLILDVKFESVVLVDFLFPFPFFVLPIIIFCFDTMFSSIVGIGTTILLVIGFGTGCDGFGAGTGTGSGFGFANGIGTGTGFGAGTGFGILIGDGFGTGAAVGIVSIFTIGNGAGAVGIGTGCFGIGFGIGFTLLLVLKLEQLHNFGTSTTVINVLHNDSDKLPFLPKASASRHDAPVFGLIITNGLPILAVTSL
jgi:hypothetical protein